MRVLSSTIVIAALALHGGAAASSSPTPIVVELFTSEGCSSCPPADALLQSLVDAQPIPGAQVIGLGHHVDYWDRLGWRDKFSSGASTNRQQRYAQVFNIDSIYTPQMVVDGHDEFVGSDAAAARRTIANALSTPHAAVALAIEPPASDRVATAVTIAELPKGSRGDRADVVIAVIESRLRSEVRGGENRGRTLAHAPVVRQLTPVGDASAASLRADIPLAAAWQREHLTLVAFVQERFSRRILGAAAVPLQSAAR
jgi:hypothetical protein